jgi:hypothetical protein
VIAGVVDTGEKFITSDNDTGDKFIIGEIRQSLKLLFL